MAVNEEDLKDLEFTEEEIAQFKAEETPPPEAPPQEETKAEEPPPKETEVLTQEQKMVPLQALREAREELKELKERVRAVDSLKEQILEIKNQRKQTESQPPSFEEDPLGHTQSKLREMDTKQSEALKQIEEVKRIAEFNQFRTYVSSLENDFRRTNTDYDNAVKYMEGLVRKRMERFGVTDEKEITKTLFNETMAISNLALQAGKNPAEVIYSLAEDYGYRKPVSETKPIKDAEIKLETIKKGQEQASKTLPSGGKSADDVTVEALLDAEGEEFDKMFHEAIYGKKK